MIFGELKTWFFEVMSEEPALTGFKIIFLDFAGIKVEA